MKTKILVFLFFVSFVSSAFSETIVWYTVTRPPWFMKNLDGYADHMQASYQALLPQYEHTSKKMNLARMIVELERGEKFCIAALAKIPHMNQNVHLSKTTYLLPAPKIFMTTKTFVEMGSPKSLSIKALAEDSQYRLGLIGGVKHLPITSEDFKDAGHVSIISNDFPIVSIMRMVDAGRIDWSADFPHMIQWGSESGNIRIKDAFEMVDIAEYEGGGEIKAGVACSKNAWGKAIIDQLNLLLDEEVMQSNIRIVSRWMPPGHVMDEFYRLNRSLLGKN